ncbi:MAG: AAA family ATPase [bacterium]|nr:AAA family ATPase [bacterium]
MIIVLFGLPGAGKTYVGNILKENFSFFLHDGDNDLPKLMKQTLMSKKAINNTMRDEFFKKLIASVKKLSAKYNKLTITQTFIKEKYRLQFLQQFPETRFMLIASNADIRRERLKKRKVGFPLDSEYAKSMDKIFESPKINHTVLINEKDGKEELLRQLKKLFSQKENQ